MEWSNWAAVNQEVGKPPGARILYITYDGLTDPLGQSQVLPYLVGLSERGHRITILSCEKQRAMDTEGTAIRKQCKAAGLDWQPLTYHKNPPVLSSILDLGMLRGAAARLHRARGFTLVHCRSYVPAAVGLHLKRRFGIPLLFDMRGFWPEEKTEGGSWDLRNPLFRLVYRYFKRLERKLLVESDAIISLTEAGTAELLRRPELRGDVGRITVIPCCVDVKHFALADQVTRRTAREELGFADNASVLTYLGSVGTWYMLDEMLDFFRVYRERHSGARFLFITPDDASHIRMRAAARRISADEITVVKARREQVPRLLSAGDLGIFFIQPVSSKVASSPTKMGEMLAVGLPLVANAGVGDVAETLANTGAGATVTRFTEPDYKRALAQVEADGPTPRERRQAAIDGFDVQLGIERYDGIYRRLQTDAAVGNGHAPR